MIIAGRLRQDREKAGVLGTFGSSPVSRRAGWLGSAWRQMRRSCFRPAGGFGGVADEVFHIAHALFRLGLFVDSKLRARFCEWLPWVKPGFGSR